MSRRHRVAFLGAHGVGPELIAEASRALAEVAALHGFVIDETHVPMGAEAVARLGESVPAATRQAVLAADAVLAPTRRDPALRVVEGDLDLRAAAVRVRDGRRHDAVVVRPLAAADRDWTLRRALQLAAARGGCVTLVGAPGAFEGAGEAADRHPGVDVATLPPAAALRELGMGPNGLDVVVGDDVYGPALVEVAAGSPGDGRVVATARLAEHGPSVFAAAHGHAASIAGQGVANPCSIMLAASFMLADGLGERAAAETLAGAVAAALDGGVRTPDLVETGPGATTREFVDAVLSLFQVATPTAEFAREAWA